MAAEGAKEARATKLRIGKHDLMKEGLVEIRVEGIGRKASLLFPVHLSPLTFDLPFLKVDTVGSWNEFHVLEKHHTRW